MRTSEYCNVVRAQAQLNFVLFYFSTNGIWIAISLQRRPQQQQQDDNANVNASVVVVELSESEYNKQWERATITSHTEESQALGQESGSERERTVGAS